MVPAPDAASFLVSPIGTYVAGASFVAWVQSPARIGMFHVGNFDRADMPALQQIFPLVAHPELADRYDLFHDIAEVVVFDEPAFRFFRAFLEQWVHVLVPRVRRLAVVRPGGVAGAAFAGMFHEWVVPRFDAKLCANRAEAYTFLDVSDDDRARLDGVANAREPVLRRLREVLAADLTATLVQAAAAMSTSTRTLQRILTANRTTFRRELIDARMRVAQTMLLEREDKVEAIAVELGFASAAAFSTIFRRIIGDTPSAFRERYRTAGTDRQPR